MPPIFVNLGNASNTRTFDDQDYVIVGGDGNNTLTFGNGDNKLTLANGNNTLTLGDGDDTITAGEGNNTVTVKGVGPSRLLFADGDNTITIDDGPTRIVAGDGLNAVTTGDGNANILLGDGINQLTTGDGNSRITVGDGNGNTLTVGIGSNTVNIGAGSATILHAGGGDNTVFHAAATLGTATIQGGLNTGDGTGNTLVFTSFGLIDALGVSGFETFRLANGGANSLSLADANFSRLPGHVINVLGGDSGDVVDASTLSVAHAVSVRAGLGQDVLTGGAAIDTLSYAGSAAAVVVNLTTGDARGGDAEGDVIASFENLIGSASNDRLSGDAGVNVLYGGAGRDMLTGAGGNDVLVGGEGADTLDGGSGADRMSGGSGHDTYIVDTLRDRVIETSADDGTDLVSASVSFNLGAHVENLTLTGIAVTGGGNALANQLVGNGEGNRLSGGDGNDTLIGGAGNDSLHGGSGADRLSGGGGGDIFFFNTALGAGNVDLVTDFQVGLDRIALASSIFALPRGRLLDEAFEIGTRAFEADDRIIYNDATGILSYDADGVGGDAALRFATLATGLALTESDFIVVA